MNGKITRGWPNRGRFVEQRESGTGEIAKLIPVGVRKIPIGFAEIGSSESRNEYSVPCPSATNSVFWLAKADEGYSARRESWVSEL
jgi:hypothetical protein